MLVGSELVCLASCAVDEAVEDEDAGAEVAFVLFEEVFAVLVGSTVVVACSVVDVPAVVISSGVVVIAVSDIEVSVEL